MTSNPASTNLRPVISAAERALPPWARNLPFLLMSLWLCAWLYAVLVLYTGIHGPVCGLKSWFGIPCLFCGGTRAAVLLASGELHEAFAMNPLVSTLALGIPIVFLLWFIEKATGWPAWSRVVWGMLCKWPVKVWIGIAALQWLYSIVVFRP